MKDQVNYTLRTELDELHNGQSSLMEWNKQASSHEKTSIWVLNPLELEGEAPEFYLEKSYGEKKPRVIVWENEKEKDSEEADEQDDRYYVKATTLDTEGYLDYSQSVWVVNRA